MVATLAQVRTHDRNKVLCVMFLHSVVTGAHGYPGGIPASLEVDNRRLGRSSLDARHPSRLRRARPG